MFPQINFKNNNWLGIVPQVFWKCIKCPWGSRVQTFLLPQQPSLHHLPLPHCFSLCQNPSPQFLPLLHHSHSQKLQSHHFQYPLHHHILHQLSQAGKTYQSSHSKQWKKNNNVNLYWCFHKTLIWIICDVRLMNNVNTVR